MEKTILWAFVNQKSILARVFPTQRCIALRPECSEKYAKIARMSSKSDSPRCSSMVSNEQMKITYTRTSSINDMPRDLSVLSNEKGHIGFKHRTLRKAKPLRLRMWSWNISSLIGRFLDLVHIMKIRKFYILCLQETKWLIDKAKIVVWKVGLYIVVLETI